MYKGKHSFQTDKGSYSINIARLKVLAQPVGAYADWLLDDELYGRKGGRQSEIAILDLGMNTFDLYVIQDGKVAPRYIGEDKVGMRRLLELLNANGHDAEELDAQLRTDKLQPSKDQFESWLSEALAAIERTWPSLRRFGAVIPTGGGARVLSDRLNIALIAKGAVMSCPADPITANVKGSGNGAPIAISQQSNGNLIITVRITFQPGRDDDLIDLISKAPKGALAGLIREATRNGVSTGKTVFVDESAEELAEMSGLGMEI